MNAYTTSIDPVGGLAGNTPTPFDYGSCRCHAAVQLSGNLIATQRGATMTAVDRAATAIARSKDIDWSGTTADLFRSQLDRAATMATLLADDVDATHRLALGAS